MILSAYRPYESKESSEGALRTAIIKVVPDFEEEFWAELCKPSGTPTLIGGDFNMSPEEVDKRLLGSRQSRVGLPPGMTTYRSLSKASGSVIDHIISNSKATANVEEDGSFVGDHYPMIGGIKLESMGDPIPVKIEAKIPKTIQPGDAGGLRRLNEAIMKKFPGDLTGHSVEEITEWTVKQARAIAASRNSKNHPNGWSPLSRILHLRLRALGALYKRSMDGAGIGPCYRLYMDARRDIMKVTLNEDEMNWLDSNGVERMLPEWRIWQRDFDLDRLRLEIQSLRKMSTKERRDELRILHGGRMRRI